MSAPQITIFLPSGRDYWPLLHEIAGSLSLTIDTMSGGPFAFSAQRVGTEHVLVEFDADSTEITDEMRREWEKPSQEYKSLLQGCDSCIVVHYRSVRLAKQCLDVIGDDFGRLSSCSVVENGYGCLLRLSEIVERISGDATWSWERETFPNLPGVADSEWID